MSLRLKVFLVIGTVLMLFFLVVNQLISFLVIRDFSELEYRESERNVSRVVDALGNRQDSLDVKLGDWAQWDDTYQFMIDRNERYIQSNLQNESFGLLEINTVALFDLEGQAVFEKQVRNGEEESFSQDFRQHLSEDVVKEYRFSEDVHQEILLLPEGILLYVARPISSSDGTAPINGYIVFGYFFDEAVITDLSRITHLRIQSIFQSDSQKEFSEIRQHLSQENPIFIKKSENEREISGYAFFGDTHGEPIFFLRVLMDRDIYQHGQESVVLFTQTMVVMMVLFGALLFFLLNRLVLQKLTDLGRQVRKVQEDGYAENLISLPGRDEFSHLADRINDMLRALHEMEIKRKESEKRFRTIADSAPVMIWMSDTQKKYSYVNQVWLDYTGKSLADVLGDGWQSSVFADDLRVLKEACDRSFVEQKPFSVEYRLRRADGQYGWVFVRAIPHFTVERVFLGYIGSCVDITERKEAENQKQQYIEEIEKMNRIMVERELRMIELKKEIQALKNTGRVL